MILVQFLPDRNVLCVTGIPTPFPAGSLEARQSGEMLALASPHENFLLTQWTRFDGWLQPDGEAFTSAAEAFAYLDATCRKKRPVGLLRLAFTADEPLGGHQVVRISGLGRVQIASCADVAQAGYAIGVTMGAADLGADVPVMVIGEMIEPSWSFTLGPVFLGLNGALVQAPPTTGFVLQVGTAIEPTRLIVALDEPYILAA